MLLQALYIGLGGFFGSIARWLLSRYLSSWSGMFPLGTVTVNVLGCIAIGFLLYATVTGRIASLEFRNFAAIGFIGAFTTMSTFTYEAVRLFELRVNGLFVMYVVANLFLCPLGLLLGRYMATVLIK